MKRKEHTFEDLILRPVLDKTNLNYIPQYKVFTRKHGAKRIDFYLPTIKVAIEYDEYYHSLFDQVRQDKQRETLIASILHCEFIRFPEHEPRALAMKRLEKFLRAKGVKFINDLSDRARLLDKIHNCENKLEALPHLFDFYYQRLITYQAELADFDALTATAE